MLSRPEQQTARLSERFFLCFASVLAIVFLAYCWNASQVKALDYDETFTFNLAHQVTWPTYRFGMVADGNPPLGSLLCHLSMALLGDSEFALRLPSILTTCAAVLLFGCFLRKRTGAPLALAGMAMLLADPVLRGYAIEARPYGLVLLFTALAMLCWQRCDPTRADIWPYVGVAFAIAGALLSHYFAIVSVGLPLLAGEALRFARRRSLDKRLIVSAMLGLQAAWLTIPAMLATQRLLGPKSLPSPFSRTYALLWAYRQLVSPSYLAALAFGLVLCAVFGYAGRTRPAVRLTWPQEEILALAASLFALVVVAFAVPVSVTFGFRYAIGSVFGFVGLLICLLRWATPLGAFGLMLCMLANFVPRTHLASRTGDGIVDSRLSVAEVDKELACLSNTASSLELAVEAGMLYPTLYHYADPGLKIRLHYLTDLSYLPHQVEDIPQVTLLAQRPVFPQGLRDYAGFVRQHRQFLLVDHGYDSVDKANLSARLAHDGLQQTAYPLNGCASAHLSAWMVTAR